MTTIEKITLLAGTAASAALLTWIIRDIARVLA